jgi:adenosylcobinamide-GDP ribazoletransferase
VWLAGWTLVLGALLVAAVVGAGSAAVAGWLALSGTAGLLAAEVVYRRARARLGGVTGDVMGAMGETATAAVLLVAAVAVR